MGAPITIEEDIIKQMCDEELKLVEKNDASKQRVQDLQKPEVQVAQLCSCTRISSRIAMGGGRGEETETRHKQPFLQTYSMCMNQIRRG